MKQLPLFNVFRSPQKIRPFKALSHFRKLVANKEDTKHVFHIIKELSGQSLIRDLQRFINSPDGAKRIKARRDLPAILDDHDKLKQLPVDSVGHIYMDFMQREGLSAAGLVKEFDEFNQHTISYNDILQWYEHRLRDTHDLLHILTGYGRDALGEACVLAFSYAQNKSPGIIFISYMTALEYKRTRLPRAPIVGAVNEAKRHGQLALALAEQDIPALLAEPLISARARMGIKPPNIYGRVHDIYRSQGCDPLKALT